MRIREGRSVRSAGAALLLAVLAVSCTNEYSIAVAVPSARGGAPPAAAAPIATTSTVPSIEVSGPIATAPPPSTTTTVPASITLGFVGDVQMIGSMTANQPLAAVTELLSAPDLMFANLETVIGNADEVGSPPIDKEFIFRSPPETLDQLVAAGVDLLGLANNHSWDYGPLGAAVTRAYVDASPLLGTGVGADPAAAYAPVFADVRGQTVGVVSLSRVPCDWSRDPQAQRLEIAWGCDRFSIPAIGAISQSIDAADHTVVMLHGGTEVTECPDAVLRDVIDVWIAVGVDVIAISHPHVVQGVEIIDGVPVLWSTGNFAFRNWGGRTGRSAVFEVTLAADGPSVVVHPTMLPGGVAAPADPDTAEIIRSEISDRSVGGRIDVDGRLVSDTEPSLCG